jgi:hypothetical protein
MSPPRDLASLKKYARHAKVDSSRRQRGCPAVIDETADF